MRATTKLNLNRRPLHGNGRQAFNVGTENLGAHHPPMSFLGPFVATWVLTMASLALIVVLKSDKAEPNQ